MIRPEEKKILFLAQVKAINASQLLKANPTALSENQIKHLLSEQLSIFYQLEPIFLSRNIIDLYKLIKGICFNYANLGLSLINELEKLKVKQDIKTEEKTPPSTPKPVVVASSQLGKVVGGKIPRLGGVHLYNENYIRSIEDVRVWEEIQRMKNNAPITDELKKFKESILSELEQQTEVEKMTTGDDQIAHYILETRKKGSLLNYMPSDGQLQKMLLSLNNSQKEASDFLDKLSQLGSYEYVKFSLTEIEDGMSRNSTHVQHEIMARLKQVMDKFKKK